jgi:predicted  nucleic acid-binding Zn-ribbon protein
MASTKKTPAAAKVEAPIDQRETFVSLQKSFADSDMPVEEKLKTLYQLQEADSEIDKIIQLRGELPAEVAALEDEIASLKERSAGISAVIDQLNRNIADAKLSISEHEGVIEKYQRQLETISNSREYDSLNKEIENQELLRQIDEKTINDTRYEIGARKAELDELKDRLSIRMEDLKAKKQELENIVEETAKEEAVLRERREACAAKIDARTMSAYERIRASVHNHLAVVGIYNGDSCGGCFNTITPQRRVEIGSNRKLIICEHCGRIIINPDFEA